MRGARCKVCDVLAEPRSSDAVAVRRRGIAVFAGMLLFDLPGRAFAGFADRAAGHRGRHVLGADLHGPGAARLVQRAIRSPNSSRRRCCLGPLFVRWRSASTTAGCRCARGSRAARRNLSTQSLKFLWLSRSEQFELRGSSLLLVGQIAEAVPVSLALLIAAGIVGR